MHSSIDAITRQPEVISFPARLDSGPFARVTDGDLLLIPSTAALRVFAILSMHAGATGFCWPSIATLALHANVGQRWCYRILRQLTSLGLLERAEQGGRYGWLVKHSNPGLQARGVSKATLSCTPPPYIKEKKNQDIYGGPTMPPTSKVSGEFRASGDDEVPERKPPARTPKKPNPRREAILALGLIFTMTAKQRIATYEGAQDMRILGQLLDDYGEEARDVIAQAYEARDELVSDRYPKFTLHTVAFYAKFKYISKPKVDLAELIRSNTSHGTLDESNLAKACVVHGVRESELPGYLSGEVAQRVSDKIASVLARKRERNPGEVSQQDVQ